MKDIIIQALLPTAATVITTFASWALIKFKTYIESKTKSEQINEAMARITHTAQTTVDQLTQTLALNLKEASETGKLTSSNAKFLKQEAMRTVLKQIPDATKSVAELAVTSINGLISSKIEQALLKQKAILPVKVSTITGQLAETSVQ